MPSLAPAPTEAYQRPVVQIEQTADQPPRVSPIHCLPSSIHFRASQRSGSWDDSFDAFPQSTEESRQLRHVKSMGEYRVDADYSDTTSSASLEFCLYQDGFTTDGGMCCTEPRAMYTSLDQSWDALLSPDPFFDQKSCPHQTQGLWPMPAIPSSSPGRDNRHAAQSAMTFINAQALELHLSDTPPPESPPPSSTSRSKRFIQYDPSDGTPSPNFSGSQSDEDGGLKRRYVACRECRLRKVRGSSCRSGNVADC